MSIGRVVNTVQPLLVVFMPGGYKREVDLFADITDTTKMLNVSRSGLTLALGPNWQQNMRTVVVVPNDLEFGDYYMRPEAYNTFIKNLQKQVQSPNELLGLWAPETAFPHMWQSELRGVVMRRAPQNTTLTSQAALDIIRKYANLPFSSGEGAHMVLNVKISPNSMVMGDDAFNRANINSLVTSYYPITGVDWDALNDNIVRLFMREQSIAAADTNRLFQTHTMGAHVRTNQSQTLTQIVYNFPQATAQLNAGVEGFATFKQKIVSSKSGYENVISITANNIAGQKIYSLEDAKTPVIVLVTNTNERIRIVS